MRVAAIQDTPVFFDREKTTQKVLALMQEAARGGAELCTFSEVFLAGYPFWLRPQVSSIDDKMRKACLARYLEASVDVNGPELASIVEQSRRLDLFTYLGVVERADSGGTVYCSLVAIDPERGIVSVHRKLKPYFFERLIWAAVPFRRPMSGC